MIKELRKLARTDRGKANHIRNLQARGILTKIVNANGYACYETEELKQRERTVKWGRPIKDATNIKRIEKGE